MTSSLDMEVTLPPLYLLQTIIDSNVSFHSYSSINAPKQNNEAKQTGVIQLPSTHNILVYI